MPTANFIFPKRHLPAFKGAARQLSLDLFTNEHDDDMYMATVIVNDLSELVYLGFICGTDNAVNAMKNDVFSVQNALEKKINEWTKKQNDNDK